MQASHLDLSEYALAHEKWFRTSSKIHSLQKGTDILGSEGSVT